MQQPSQVDAEPPPPAVAQIPRNDLRPRTSGTAAPPRHPPPRQVAREPPDPAPNKNNAAAVIAALDPATSIVLVEVPRTIKEYRMKNDLFRIAFRRKLRLPLYPSDALCPTCKCGIRVNRYGDHFFECVDCSKSTLSNAIRGSVYSIFHHLGHLSGMVYSDTDVHHEPSGLLTCYPRKRPANVGLQLQPYHHSRTRASAHIYAAIDITISGLPGLAPDSHHQEKENIVNHMRAEVTKWKGPSRKNRSGTQVPGDQVISAMLTRRIVLLPFTVDPFGSIGPVAKRLLYGTSIQQLPYNEISQKAPPRRPSNDQEKQPPRTAPSDAPSTKQIEHGTQPQATVGMALHDHATPRRSGPKLPSAPPLVTQLAKHVQHLDRKFRCHRHRP